jgi:hypothetical protein
MRDEQYFADRRISSATVSDATDLGFDEGVGLHIVERANPSKDGDAKSPA